MTASVIELHVDADGDVIAVSVRCPLCAGRHRHSWSDDIEETFPTPCCALGYYRVTLAAA